VVPGPIQKNCPHPKLGTATFNHLFFRAWMEGYLNNESYTYVIAKHNRGKWGSDVQRLETIPNGSPIDQYLHWAREESNKVQSPTSIGLFQQLVFRRELSKKFSNFKLTDLIGTSNSW